MRKFIKIIQYFILLILSRVLKKDLSLNKFPYEEIEELEKRNNLKELFQRILGNFYYRYTSFRERARVWTYKLEGEKNKHSILLELINHSKFIIFYLIIAILLSSALDWLFWFSLPILKHISFLTELFTIPSSGFIGVGLEIFVGAISAILGLIFALYTVGFQLSTDRYSEKVTDFINQESVSNYFFSLLIFTDLFSIYALIKLNLFSIIPVASFLIAAILVTISILGILIFKNHYVNSLKPINLLRSLLTLCKDQLNIATDLKNFKYKSWSLTLHARDTANRYLNTIGDLYRDLKREGNWNDAVAVPLVLGELLRYYSDVKRFIDKERGWWFFQRYEKIEADNLTMFTIKANYELQGKGPLHIPKSAEDWYENKIYGFLDEMEADVDKDNTNRLLINISSAYALILFGDSEKQTDAPPKLIPGSLLNQEFDLFEKGFKRFLGLWEKVDFSKKTIAIEFLNNYFAISTGILEDWNKDKILKIAESFYSGNQLVDSKDFLFSRELPTFSRNILNNYWERLEVEQKLEGKITTPKDRFLEEIREVLEDKKQELTDKYLTSLFANSNQIMLSLYKQGRFEYLGQFIKMQCEWISRLLYLKENNLAEKFAPNLKKSLGYLTYLPKEVVLDLELLEQSEKGYFASLIERRKELFEGYSKMSVIIMLILRDKEEDKDKLTNLIRLPVIWGAIAFLISELDQDSFYITTFTKYLEKTYQEGWMAQIMELAQRLKSPKSIFRETTRYSSWFRLVFNRMRQSLSKVPIADIRVYQESYDHPSNFIKKLGMWDFMEEEICVEEFLEWVKKREEIKKLVYVLNNLK